MCDFWKLSHIVHQMFFHDMTHEMYDFKYMSCLTTSSSTASRDVIFKLSVVINQCRRNRLMLTISQRPVPRVSLLSALASHVLFSAIRIIRWKSASYSQTHTFSALVRPVNIQLLKDDIWHVNCHQRVVTVVMLSWLRVWCLCKRQRSK